MNVINCVFMLVFIHQDVFPTSRPTPPGAPTSPNPPSLQFVFPNYPTLYIKRLFF